MSRGGAAGRHARIVATASHLPPRRVSNEELRRHLLQHDPDFDAEVIDKFEASTGIRARWWADDDVATSDLALPAARAALERAGRTPADVDLIVLGTDSPDYVTPSTSVVLQHKLGAVNAGTFDVGCACASFPTGLATAAGLLATNPNLETVLVLGAYLMHRLAAADDPMLFFYGDGASAAVLEAGDAPGFIASAFQADGSYHRHWGLYSGGTFEPASEESVRAGRTTVRMLERYPPEINHQGWPRLVRRVAEAGGFAVDDVDLFIFTQVRKPSIGVVMEELGVPVERAHTVMEEWGYTGSACVGMAFHSAVEAGKAEPGALVVFVGSGVGYNQAAAAFRMS